MELSDEDARDLRVIAGMIVPESAAFGVPGGDDDLIYADIVGSLDRDLPAVRSVLAAIRNSCGGVALADLDATARTERLDAWRRDNHGDAMLLVRVVVQCYYRDDRVLRSLGVEPRAPFPLGHRLEEVDTWSLLDEVKARGRIWRDAP